MSSKPIAWIPWGLALAVAGGLVYLLIQVQSSTQPAVKAPRVAETAAEPAQVPDTPSPAVRRAPVRLASDSPDPVAQGARDDDPAAADEKADAVANNERFYQQSIAVHDAALAAPRGGSHCESAYNSFAAMQKSFRKYDNTRSAAPARDDGTPGSHWDRIDQISNSDYIAKCQTLPKQVQRCISYREFSADHEACLSAIDDYAEGLSEPNPDFEAVSLGMPEVPHQWRGPLRERWKKESGEEP